MADRYPTIERTTLLRPQAQPVVSFVEPPRHSPRGGAELQQLAQALRSIAPDLDRYMDQEAKRQADEDFIRGQAEGLIDNEEDWAKGVQEGSIPADKSPAFVAGYLKQQGALAGLKLRSRFHGEWLAWPGKDTATPEEFDGFVANYIKSNVTTDDPRVLVGLRPHLEALTQHGYAEFDRERHRVVYEGSLKAHIASGGRAIDHYAAEGLGRDGGTDYETLAGELGALRDVALKTGIRGDDFDRHYIELVTAKAVELEDGDLLEALLQKPVPGATHTFADTPYGRAKKLASKAAIERAALRRISEQRRIDKERDKAREDALTATIVGQIFARPGAPVPEALLGEAAKYTPDIRAEAADWQKKALAGRAAEDPSDVAQVQRRIIEGEGTAAVLEAFDAGRIANPQTFRTLWNFAEQRGKGVGTASPVLQGSTYGAIKNTIRQRTLPDNLLSNPFDPGGMSDEGLQALADYEVMLLEWHGANPNASLTDIRKAQRDLGAIVLGALREGVRPEGTAAVAGPSPFGVPERTPNANPSPLDPELEAWIGSLSATERARIRTKAKATGKTERELLEELWEAHLNLQSKQPESPPGATFMEGVRDFFFGRR